MPTHVVRRGETLWEIARRYNVPLRALMAANPGVQPRQLVPGRRLRIPTPAPYDMYPRYPRYRRTRLYRVRRGENLWQIAQRYGVPVQTLVDINQLARPEMLYPGQALLIPTAILS